MVLPTKMSWRCFGEDRKQKMKIIEGLPPKKKYGWVSIDLEMWHLKPKQLHRPFGELACMTVCPDGKTVYVIRDSGKVQTAIDRISSAIMWNS